MHITQNHHFTAENTHTKRIDAKKFPDSAPSGQHRRRQDKTDVAHQHFGCDSIDKVGFVSRSALKLPGLLAIVI